MKRYLPLATIIAALLITPCSAFARSLDVWTALSTSKYVQDEVPSRSIPVDLDSGRNEHEGFQVILRSTSKIPSVSVLVGDLRSGRKTIDASNIDLRLASYIPLKGHLNGGFMPGLYPDALLPMPKTFALEAGKGQMLWVNVNIPENAEPGFYKGMLTLHAGSEVERIPIRLRVRDFQLSKENHFGSAFAVWKDQAAEYFKLSASSPEFKAMDERYYWFLTGYRLPPDDLPVSLDSPELGKYLDDPRVTSYRIPYVPEQPEEFKKSVALLRQKGWLDKGYVYTIDEPDGSTFGQCAEYGKKLHSLAPDVKWLLTAAPDKRLLGDVNIWTPILSAFSIQDCADRQAKGDIVWWYTCCGPQHPYPTYLINDSATAPRILSWFQARDRVEGVLYWAMDIWLKWDGSKYVQRDVWNDPLAFPGANGDGYLIYPGKTPNDDPVPSLRLEMIRKGNEDFETLYLLQTRYASVAEELGISIASYDPHSRVDDYVGRVGRSLVNWNHSAESLEQVRRDLLNDIESVDRGPKAILSASAVEGTYAKPRAVNATVWAEKGSSINVSMKTAEGQTQVPVEIRKNGNGVIEGKFSTGISEGKSVIAVHVIKNGSVKTIERRYSVESPKGVVLPGGKALCNWDGDSSLKDWALDATKVALTDSKELGKCAQVTYRSGMDFPNICLSLNGMSFEKAKSLNFCFHNPMDEDVILVGKLFDMNGKIADGKMMPVPAGGSVVYKWDAAEFGEGLDLAKMKSVELWMMRRPRPATVYVGAITIL